MNSLEKDNQINIGKRKYDLEDRLIDFAILVSEIIEKLSNTKLANNIGNQGTRSSTAPALIYGEVQSSESQRDFIHKVKLLLKELRETRVCLKIIMKKGLVDLQLVIPGQTHFNFSGF